MKILKIITCLTAFAAGLGLLPSQGAVLFNGTTWYASGTSSSIALSGTSLTVDTSATGGSGNFGLTYVTPTSLSVGQSVTLTVNFSFTGTNINGSSLRFGLLNSGGAANQINTDGLGQSNVKYTNYTGYASSFGNQASNANVTSALWDRTSSNTALINTAGVYTTGTTANTATGVTPPLTAGNNYTITLTLDYLSLTDMRVSNSLTGGALSSPITRSYDDASPATSFDTIVLFSTGNGSTVMTYNSVALSVVPEPSTRNSLVTALAASVFGVYFCHRRRRLRTPRI